jgi:hypothetical protein
MTRRFTMHRARAATASRETPAKPAAAVTTSADGKAQTIRPKEFGGPSGPEPTRYGDWERKGICYDF